MNENQDIIKKIEETLDKIRPFIKKDGGNVEFHSFVNGTVFIKMQGACKQCQFVNQTIKNGIEAILLEEVKEVKKVELIN